MMRIGKNDELPDCEACGVGNQKTPCEACPRRWEAEARDRQFRRQIERIKNN